MSRRDRSRLIELFYLEDLKVLNTTKSLSEYYKKATQLLPEFINPEKSYKYEKVKVKDGFIFKVETIGQDPQFIVTVKKYGNRKVTNILDFYWPELSYGFSKPQGLEGLYYLDTLAKIIKDEIIPMVDQGVLEGGIYFSPYEIDGAGEKRAKVFNRLIDKFVDKSKFNIKKLNDKDILITKND